VSCFPCFPTFVRSAIHRSLLKAEVVVSMAQDFLWVGLPQFPGMSLFLFQVQSHFEIIPYHTLVALPNPRVKPDVQLVGHRLGLVLIQLMVSEIL